MSEYAQQLLNIPLNELFEQLHSVGHDLTQENWSALLYWLRDLAAERQFENAIKRTQLCGEYAKATAHVWLEGAVYHFSGQIYALCNRPTAAIEQYQMAIDHGITLNTEDGLHQTSWALTALGSVYLTQGRLDDAIAVRKRAIDIGNQFGDNRSVLLDSIALAGVYTLKEDFKQAEDLLQATMKSAQGYPLIQALTQSELGSIKESQSDPEAALPYYHQSLDYLDEVDEDQKDDLHATLLIETLTSIAMIHEDADRYEHARDHYIVATQIASDYGDLRRQAICITWLGNAQVKAGQPHLAIRSYAAARRMCQKISYEWWLPTINFFLASAHSLLHEYDGAKTLLLETLDRLSKGDIDWVFCLMKLGEILGEAGQLQQAQEYYQQVLLNLDSFPMGILQRTIYIRLGDVFFHKKQFDDSFAMLEQALTIYEDRRQTINTPLARVTFAPSRDLVYQRLTQICLHKHDKQKALEYAEVAHARVLNEELEGRYQLSMNIEAVDWSQLQKLLKVQSYARD